MDRIEKVKLGLTLTLIALFLTGCGGGDSSSESAEQSETNNENTSVLAARPVVTREDSNVNDSGVQCEFTNIVLGDMTFEEMQGPARISITYDVTLSSFNDGTPIIGNPGSPLWNVTSSLIDDSSRSYFTDDINIHLVNGPRFVFTMNHVVPSGNRISSLILAIFNGPASFCSLSAAVDINVI